MSAVYWTRDDPKNGRVVDCPSAMLLFHVCRVNHNLFWDWDREQECYITHRWTRDGFRSEAEAWPAPTALSSLLRATREDPRMAGDPLINMLAFYITVEYLSGLL